jgi:hypothetical protein
MELIMNRVIIVLIGMLSIQSGIYGIENKKDEARKISVEKEIKPLVTNEKVVYWQYDPENPKALENELYQLPCYVKEGNVEAMSQLRAKMQEWKEQESLVNGNYERIKSRIHNCYHDFLEKKDEAAVKIMAPLAFELGTSILDAISISGDTYDKKMQKRWVIDVVSQVPGVMITDLKGSNSDEILEAWPYIPRNVQKRIKNEAKNYYRSNCPAGVNSPAKTEECKKLGNLLPSIRDAHHSFPILCKVISQEIQEQKDLKKENTEAL